MEVRIVAIDNDKSMRDLFTLGLKRKGYEVFSDSYANANLASLIQYRANLIILDFNPRDEGLSWEFLQLLKMEDEIANVPILITTTATHLPAEIREYLLVRHIDVLRKPFDLKTFLTMVDKTLAHANHIRQVFSADRSLPILMVEDTEAFSEAIEMVLKFEGYQVVTARNGLMAIEILTMVDVCLILLDVNMPVMNGYEFLSTYELQAVSHNPVVILDDEPDRQPSLPPFVVDTLSKPFQIDALLSIVEKFAEAV